MEGVRSGRERHMRVKGKDGTEIDRMGPALGIKRNLKMSRKAAGRADVTYVTTWRVLGSSGSGCTGCCRGTH